MSGVHGVNEWRGGGGGKRRYNYKDGVLTCRIYLQPAHRQTSCLIYTSRFLNSELFGWVYKPFVTIWTMQLALMSDNTSAVAYLRYQGGGGDKIPPNE